jgi:hypothetical protein
MALSLATGGASAAPITLPDPSTVPTVTYTNFISYSLPVLNALSGTDQFTVNSSPGSLRPNDVVVGTGAGGNWPVNTTAAADQPLNFPSFPQGQSGGTFSGIWNAPVAGLTSYLGGQGLVIMFNFNQTGALTDIKAFAQVTLSGPGGATATFTLGGPAQFNDPAAASTNSPGATVPINAATSAPTVSGVPGDFSGFAGDFSRFLTAFSGVCVNTTTKDIIEGVGGQSDCPAGYTFFNQNLGANQAVFAIESPGLDAALYSGLYTTLTANIWFMDLNNGYEQAFLVAGTTVPQIPEPATLAVLGVALIGLGVGIRRRRVAA